MKKKLLALASLALALPLVANAMDYKGESWENNWWSPSRLYVGAYQGYGVVDDMLHNDGQSAIGRLVFGFNAYTYPLYTIPLDFALELGLQNGKTMRHEPAFNDPDAAIDLPIQTTLNPVLDLLLSVKFHFDCNYRWFAFVKGGMAYRQLQFLIGDFVAPLNQVSGEFQAGIGYDLTRKARVVAYYQGIYKNDKVRYSQDDTGFVRVSNIPTQQAGFLGFEYSL